MNPNHLSDPWEVIPLSFRIPNYYHYLCGCMLCSIVVCPSKGQISIVPYVENTARRLRRRAIVAEFLIGL